MELRQDPKTGVYGAKTCTGPSAPLPRGRGVYQRHMASKLRPLVGRERDGVRRVQVIRGQGPLRGAAEVGGQHVHNVAH